MLNSRSPIVRRSGRKDSPTLLLLGRSRCDFGCGLVILAGLDNLCCNLKPRRVGTVFTSIFIIMALQTLNASRVDLASSLLQSLAVRYRFIRGDRRMNSSKIDLTVPED